MEITYNGITYQTLIKRHGYTNGNTVIILTKKELDIDGEDDISEEERFIVTTNLYESISEDLVYIKNYGELSGIDDVLVEAGVTDEFPLFVVPSGHVRIPVYQLTDQAIKEMI